MLYQSAKALRERSISDTQLTAHFLRPIENAREKRQDIAPTCANLP
jgi:hypothetical protein